MCRGSPLTAQSDFDVSTDAPTDALTDTEGSIESDSENKDSVSNPRHGQFGISSEVPDMADSATFCEERKGTYNGEVGDLGTLETERPRLPPDPTPQGPPAQPPGVFAVPAPPQQVRLYNKYGEPIPDLATHIAGRCVPCSNAKQRRRCKRGIQDYCFSVRYNCEHCHHDDHGIAKRKGPRERQEEARRQEREYGMQ